MAKPETKSVHWEVLPPEEEKRRARVEPLFRWASILMDNLVRLPGTRFRFGLNPLIDFIPAVGDISAAFVSTSVLLYALRNGLPKVLLARMGLNILINEMVGIVPVVGSAFAFWFRANYRNYELLRSHHAAPHQPRRGDALFVTVMIVVILATIALGMVVSLLAVRAVLHFLLGQ